MYYNKKDEVIDLSEYVKLLTDYEYKIIKQETLPNGKWVSTVWLGLDHNFGRDGNPMIFETMVFPSRGNYLEEYMERYSTQEEAIKGHERIANDFKKEVVDEMDKED